MLLATAEGGGWGEVAQIVIVIARATVSDSRAHNTCHDCAHVVYGRVYELRRRGTGMAKQTDRRDVKGICSHGKSQLFSPPSTPSPFPSSSSSKYFKSVPRQVFFALRTRNRLWACSVIYTERINNNFSTRRFRANPCAGGSFHFYFCFYFYYVATHFRVTGQNNFEKSERKSRGTVSLNRKKNHFEGILP